MPEPVSLSADEYAQWMSEWEAAIGKFMITFAMCEYWTYSFVGTFGTKQESTEAKGLFLGRRADLAKKVTLRIGLKPDIHKAVQKAFNHIKKLAVTRNLVAHNSPMFHVAKENDDGSVVLEIQLRSVVNDAESITIPTIVDRIQEAADLETDLALLYGSVRQKKNHL